MLSHAINDFHSTRSPPLHFEATGNDADEKGEPGDQVPSDKQDNGKVLPGDHPMRDSPQSTARSFESGAAPR